MLAELEAQGGATRRELRRSLARRAYARTAAYDAAIASWMAAREGIAFPETLVVAARLGEVARYGENPHQQGAVYRTDERHPGVATARLLPGREMSYNNYNDTDAEFDRPAVVIVKHANPCGVALGASLHAAWVRALACDPVSTFGGVVAVNHILDAATAAAIAELFVEVVIAPEIGADARPPGLSRRLPEPCRPPSPHPSRAPGRELLYHGDFDWAGPQIDIASQADADGPWLQGSDE